MNNYGIGFADCLEKYEFNALFQIRARRAHQLVEKAFSTKKNKE